MDLLKNKGKMVDLNSYIKRLLKLMKGKPVSLEVTNYDYEGMVKEGKKLFKRFNRIAKNVYIKIPINTSFDKERDFDGIKAIKELSKNRIPVNCTLIFTPEQALLAAKAGAKIVSPFAGRVDDYLRKKAKIKFKKSDYYSKDGLKRNGKIIDDNGIVSGVDLIIKCVEIFRKHNIRAEVLAASIRNARQFREVALAGADIATVPFSVVKELLRHFKTVEGMRDFTNDVVKEYAELGK